jgi:hypothetical protein
MLAFHSTQRCPSFLDSINIFPVKCFVSPLGAEHYQSLETALTDVRQHFLTVDLFHIEFCNDIAF